MRVVLKYNNGEHYEDNYEYEFTVYRCETEEEATKYIQEVIPEDGYEEVKEEDELYKRAWVKGDRTFVRWSGTLRSGETIYESLAFSIRK